MGLFQHNCQKIAKWFYENEGGGSKAAWNFSVWYRLLSLTSIITCIIICTYFFFSWVVLLFADTCASWAFLGTKSPGHHKGVTDYCKTNNEKSSITHHSCIRVPKFWCHNNNWKIHFLFQLLFGNILYKVEKLDTYWKKRQYPFSLLLCSRNFFSFSKHFRSPPRSPQVISSRLQIIAKPFCETTVGCIFYYSCTGDCCNNIVQKNKPEAGIFFRGKNEEVQHKTFSFLDSMKQKGHPKILLGYLSQKDPSMQ